MSSKHTKDIINSIVDELVNNTLVKSYENHIKNMRSYIRSYYNEIKNIEKDIKLCEKIIYKTCIHNWVRDYDDRCSRCKVCTKCGLPNLPYVYA